MVKSLVMPEERRPEEQHREEQCPEAPSREAESADVLAPDEQLLKEQLLKEQLLEQQISLGLPLDESLMPDVTQWVTEDDMPVDNWGSAKQQRFLAGTLYSAWPEKVFLAEANVGIYYIDGKPAIVPDVFVSFDVQVPQNWWEKKHRCYIVWMFGKPPEIAIEIVSNTVGGELAEKFAIYEQMRVSYYVVYDPQQKLSPNPLRIYELRGSRYVELDSRWLSQVKLGLTLWTGTFEQREDTWLRWCDQDGVVLLTGDERAEQERAIAGQERVRAEQIQRAAIAQFLKFGLSPDQIAESLGLDRADVDRLSVLPPAE